MDKLIQQTQQINDTNPTEDIKDLTTVDETESLAGKPPLNDSNIYYFKTFMNPQINFKSSSEVVHETRPSNKTVQSDEVSDDDHDPTSEEKPFPGGSKITRKSLLGVQQQKTVQHQSVQSSKKEYMPRLIHGGHSETMYSEFKSKTGKPDSDENNYALQELIKNEIVSGLSTMNDNTHISFTQSGGHQNKQLSLLHEYPEIIIDHIAYDNDENDKNTVHKLKSAHETQHVQHMQKKVVKGEMNNRVSLVPPQKIRYNIPEEEIHELAHAQRQDFDMQEQFEPVNYLTPEMKGLIDVIIQKQVMQDALLKQTTESESRKTSMLLEKILQRLPEQRPMINNVKSSYSVRHERIAPVEMQTLSHIHSSLNTLHRNGGNHLVNSYMKVPYAPSKWEIRNRLLRRLIRLYRPDVLKRTRLVAAGLIDRIVPNINYQPVYYDLYKK